MNQELEMNPNRVVAYLGKPCNEFTKADIVKYIKENNIRMVNFMYPAGDGRLKTLNFVINNAAYLDAILTCGERVDGSSLSPFIEAGSSDLYVIPRFRTAFLDPFAEIPTLSMLCSFFNKDGEPLESSPEHTLHKACRAFNEVTGMEFQAMGELEYYVIAPDSGMFPATDHRWSHLRTERNRVPSGQCRRSSRPVDDCQMDYPQPRLQIGLRHYLCPENHYWKSRLGSPHPYAYCKGWSESDA